MARAKVRALNPRKVSRVVKSLTIMDIDVANLQKRVAGSPSVRAGSGDLCVIDCSCCIIDCSKCLPEDQEIYIDPDPTRQIEGFAFKLPGDARDKNAPVYLLPQMQFRTAFALGHRSISVPGKLVEGRVLGLAGEVLSARALQKNGISTTAPVIALSPKALATRAARSLKAPATREVGRRSTRAK